MRRGLRLSTITAGILMSTALHAGSVLSGTANVSGGTDAVIAGGGTNTTAATRSFIGAGYGNAATNSYASITGGYQNRAEGYASTIVGGRGGIASGNYAFIGGGKDNRSSGQYAFVGGGFKNKASGEYAYVNGGRVNSASGQYAAVMAGTYNTASAEGAFVGGGGENQTTHAYSTVGGGNNNSASELYATVSGGRQNVASGNHSTVSGGYNNHSTGLYSVIPGGKENNASGAYSTVIGTRSTASADYAMAFGAYLEVKHAGSVIFGDSNSDYSDSDLIDRDSDMNNRFYGYFNNGYYLYTSGGRSSATGVYVDGGGGAWNNVSDKTKKENFKDVDKSEVLQKLMAMPIKSWNYKSQDKGIRHIGPFAQDFKAAYGLGDDKQSISTIDTDGIALVSIQALNEKVQQQESALTGLRKEKDREIASLKEKMQIKEKETMALQARVEKLETLLLK